MRDGSAHGLWWSVRCATGRHDPAASTLGRIEARVAQDLRRDLARIYPVEAGYEHATRTLRGSVWGHVLKVYRGDFEARVSLQRYATDRGEELRVVAKIGSVAVLRARRDFERACHRARLLSGLVGLGTAAAVGLSLLGADAWSAGGQLLRQAAGLWASAAAGWLTAAEVRRRALARARSRAERALRQVSRDGELHASLRTLPALGAALRGARVRALDAPGATPFRGGVLALESSEGTLPA